MIEYDNMDDAMEDISEEEKKLVDSYVEDDEDKEMLFPKDEGEDEDN